MIRRDLYGVKEFQDGKWVVVLITKKLNHATNLISVLGHKKIVKPKLVFPNQLTVDAWLAVGNQIHDYV